MNLIRALFRRFPTAPARPLHPFDALLLHWLTLGGLILLLVPVRHWHAQSVGWLPYWLLAAPLLLTVLRRAARG